MLAFDVDSPRRPSGPSKDGGGAAAAAAGGARRSVQALELEEAVGATGTEGAPPRRRCASCCCRRCTVS